MVQPKVIVVATHIDECKLSSDELQQMETQIHENYGKEFEYLAFEAISCVTDEHIDRLKTTIEQVVSQDPKLVQDVCYFKH